MRRVILTLFALLAGAAAPAEPPSGWSAEALSAGGALTFRKKISLEEKPLRAYATVFGAADSELRINGETALAHQGGFRDIDIGPFMEKGENVIVWTGRRGGTFIIEGKAVFHDGSYTPIISGPDWKYFPGAPPRGSGSADFDDSKWAPATAGGQPFADFPLAVSPVHAGIIDARPGDRETPVFDANSAPRFKVSVPAGVSGVFRAELLALNPATGEKYGPMKITLNERDNFREKDGFLESSVKFWKIPAGVWTLQWSLINRRGNVCESRSDEIIVTGPVDQERYRISSFDDALERRLERVWSVECTGKPVTRGVFIDSPNGSSHVIGENDTAFRETGADKGDFFAYKMDGLTKDAWHIAEALIPDGGKRSVVLAALESPPPGQTGEPVVSARVSVETGELSSGTPGPQALRLLFRERGLPLSLAVACGSGGRRAAAVKIVVFSVKRGRLPALYVREQNKLLGGAREDEIFSRIKALEGVPGTGARRILFRSLENEIERMRFYGENLSVLQVSDSSGFPADSALFPMRRLDSARARIKTAEHNKIKTLAAFTPLSDGMDGLARRVIEFREHFSGAGGVAGVLICGFPGGAKAEAAAKKTADSIAKGPNPWKLCILPPRPAAVPEEGALLFSDKTSPLRAAALFFQGRGVNLTGAGIKIDRTLPGRDEKTASLLADKTAESAPEIVILSGGEDDSDGSARRRAAADFYEREANLKFERLPEDAFRGVSARGAGQGRDFCLQLVNNTPFPAAGIITGPDMITDTLMNERLIKSDGQIKIDLAPFDIRIFKMTGQAEEPAGSFGFSPESTAALQRAAKEALPAAGEKSAELRDAIKNDDTLKVYNILQSLRR